MSQSALTQAVARLEHLLNERLFDREASGTFMTPAGRAFLQRTDQALNFIKEGALSVRRIGRMSSTPNIGHRFTASQLRALITVDRLENYTGAAKAAGLAQPTVHRAIRQIEHILGTRLYLASGRTLRATDAGKLFARFARLAVVELQAALDEILALSKPNWGRIVIGSLPLARASILPTALAKFSCENPNTSIMVLEGAYPTMLEGLRHGEIDILLGALRDPPPAPDVEQVPLFSTDLYVVANASHPLAGVSQPTVEQLRSYPWVAALPGAPMRDKWNNFFSSSGVPVPERVIVCGSVVVIRALLLEDNYLAFLSEDQFKIEEAHDLLTRIGPPISGSHRQIGFTHRSGWRPTAMQERFIQSLREVSVKRQIEENAKGVTNHVK
jgi:DNA-binding transcriptional LysR family regulator